MPYKYYQLVTAEGRLVERQDKHPFCMSRVYYNRTERPGEVWAEDADASYRWRQSGSEVKVIALKVRTAVLQLIVSSTSGLDAWGSSCTCPILVYACNADELMGVCTNLDAGLINAVGYHQDSFSMHPGVLAAASSPK